MLLCFGPLPLFLLLQLAPTVNAAANTVLSVIACPIYTIPLQVLVVVNQQVRDLWYLYRSRSHQLTTIESLPWPATTPSTPMDMVQSYMRPSVRPFHLYH